MAHLGSIERWIGKVIVKKITNNSWVHFCPDFN